MSIKLNRSLAAEGRRSTAGCSSQQAAAAWAWFEHGGSTCITPSKAEGLMAAKRRNAKCNFAGPSRFMKDAAIPQHSAGRSDDAIAKGHARRRRSFHDDDLARCTSYCRTAPTSPRFNIDEGPDENETEDEEGGCQVDDQASSLLDKFEADAVCRQLHDHLSTSFRTPSSTCSAELQELYHEAQKAHHDHPQAHIKPRRYFKSSDARKPLAGTEHHQNINDVVHRLLRLRIKTSTISSRSTSTTAPAFCSSIATADSIVDRHHPASPKQFRAGRPINQTSKRQNTGRVSNHSGELKRNQVLETADEGSAAGQHKRGEFASSHRKSQQKMPARTDVELIGGAPPSRLHHSDLIYSKVLQPLMNRLPPLLGHNMHGAPSTDDGVVRTNRHRLFHQHHHIIHHHHHYYHHLQHIHQASQDAVLPDHLITKNDFAHVLHPPKLYSFHKEELMVPSAGRPHHVSTLQH